MMLTIKQTLLNTLQNLHFVLFRQSVGFVLNFVASEFDFYCFNKTCLSGKKMSWNEFW